MLIELVNNDAEEDVTIPMGGRLRRNQPDPREVYKGNTRVYVFQRENPGAPLLCNVADERDIGAFLAIREGYQPYGADAQQEAKEGYGWSPDLPVFKSERELPPGQPDVVDEMLDDDDETGEGLAANDLDGQEEVNVNDGPPAVPPDDAADEVWIVYAQLLVKNPQDKNELEAYAKKNYGIDLDRRLAPLTLIKQIGEAQRKAD